VEEELTCTRALQRYYTATCNGIWAKIYKRSTEAKETRKPLHHAGSARISWQRSIAVGIRRIHVLLQELSEPLLETLLKLGLIPCLRHGLRHWGWRRRRCGCRRGRPRRCRSRPGGGCRVSEHERTLASTCRGWALRRNRRRIAHLSEWGRCVVRPERLGVLVHRRRLHV
jgi:hypothetical protein